jgi:hypothetical protein
LGSLPQRDARNESISLYRRAWHGNCPPAKTARSVPPEDSQADYLRYSVTCPGRGQRSGHLPVTRVCLSGYVLALNRNLAPPLDSCVAFFNLGVPASDSGSDNRRKLMRTVNLTVGVFSTILLPFSTAQGTRLPNGSGKQSSSIYPSGVTPLLRRSYSSVHPQECC